MMDVHEGLVGGHYVGKSTAPKIMRTRLWWPTIFRDTKDYYNSCDVCQRVGKTSWGDEMPLKPKATLLTYLSHV